MPMLTDNDKIQLRKLGISEKQVLTQMENFLKGFPFTCLVKPAIIGDGLIRLGDSETREMASLYDELATSLDIVKFIPASGAATRMFKDLYAFLDEPEAYDEQSVENKHPEVHRFFSRIDQFAFYHKLDAHFKGQLKKHSREGRYREVLKGLLGSEGLNYGSLPKGLLTFHRYDDHHRTSIEEHWVEGSLYARNKAGKARLHFTISPSHEDAFLELIEKQKPVYENRLGVSLDISYSFQKPSTDVVAVDMNNEFFRNEDGSLLFRPGGHGALLENLNDLDADLVFIKNIDNIVPDRLKHTTVLYKKALAGTLLKLKQKIDRYLDRLEKGVTTEQLNEIQMFAEKELYVITTDKHESASVNYLKNILDRPLRVCGMVRNEGEPGGGPFWVKDAKENLSLQIVESSQVDMGNPEQKMIFSGSTHFNPVDLVCFLRDRHGKKYFLPDYVDPQTGFITVKSKDGRKLKAQELPGLWNGAMAKWNTVFVEVPLDTFNPVKTVNDLLRDSHQ